MVESSAPLRVRLITITVSDTRTEENDGSGRILGEELAQFDRVRHVILPDEPDAIRRELTAIANANEADAVVLSGGTGIAPRDRTHEAVLSLFEKRLDGFGEAFRRLSWEEVGPRAILSRATAGTIRTVLVFSLPGSENAARLGAKALIAPILAHAVAQVNGRTAHEKKS